MGVVLNINIKNISKEVDDVNISIAIKSKVSQVTENIVGRVMINTPVSFVKKIQGLVFCRRVGFFGIHFKAIAESIRVRISFDFKVGTR